MLAVSQGEVEFQQEVLSSATQYGAWIERVSCFEQIQSNYPTSQTQTVPAIIKKATKSYLVASHAQAARGSRQRQEHVTSLR